MLTFHEIDLARRQEYLRYIVGQQRENSEFSFATLYLWSRLWSVQVCERPEALYISSRLPGSGEPIHWQPWLREGYPATAAVETVERDMAERGHPLHIKYASRAFVDKLAREGSPYVCRPVRDEFDYLYNRRDLAELPGKRFHAKRNHVNRFVRQYRYTYRALEPSDLEDCLRIYCRWYAGRDDVDIAAEKPVIEQALAHMQALSLCGGMLYVADTPAAFIVGEIMDDIALVHLEKAIPQVDGAFQMINQLFAQSLPPSVAFINREEDMGIEGMRKAKLSYHPVRLLEKYDITR